jgi:hypothetical protein
MENPGTLKRAGAGGDLAWRAKSPPGYYPTETGGKFERGALPAVLPANTGEQQTFMSMMSAPF